MINYDNIITDAVFHDLFHLHFNSIQRSDLRTPLWKARYEHMAQDRPCPKRAYDLNKNVYKVNWLAIGQAAGFLVSISVLWLTLPFAAHTSYLLWLILSGKVEVAWNHLCIIQVIQPWRISLISFKIILMWLRKHIKWPISRT